MQVGNMCTSVRDIGDLGSLSVYRFLCLHEMWGRFNIKQAEERAHTLVYCDPPLFHEYTVPDACPGTSSEITTKSRR